MRGRGPARAQTEERTLRLPAHRPAPDQQRALQLALAGCWLLDAVLQCQPFMFGRGFARMLAASGRGNPAVVTGPVTWAAHLTAQHPVPANAAFATVQLLLALGIAWRPAVKAALAASIAWALGVWWLGEGLGGVLTPAANPVTGAPGAAVLYALLAVLLWPRTVRRSASLPFAAAWGVGAPAARAVWLVLWSGLAWLSLADAPAAGVPALASGPGPVLLAALCCVIAAGIILPDRGVRCVVVLAVAAALAMWSAGQGFGGMLTGTGTDPGTGPLLALLAVAYWPGAATPAAAPGATLRLATGPVRGLPAVRRDVVVMQVLMGAATLAMLAPVPDPAPPAAWQAVAAAGVGWFMWRLLRHAAAGGPPETGSHDLMHALACAAMLFMLLVPAGMTAPMAGAGAAAPGPAIPPLALFFALAMLASAVVTTDRLAARAPGGAAAALVSGRIAACCQIAMGIVMAHLLIQML